MLPAAYRLRDAEDFRRTTRSGVRGSAGSVVVHCAVPEDAGVAPRIGFVTSKRVGNAVVRNRVKRVGNAVVRNRVKRRLRHQLAQRLEQLPRGATLVVRATPRAARASSAALGADVDRALARLRGGAR